MAQLYGITGQYFPMVTVTSYEEHLMVELLTYAELLKKDEVEEEANIFETWAILKLSARFKAVQPGLKLPSPFYNPIADPDRFEMGHSDTPEHYRTIAHHLSCYSVGQ